MTEIHAASGTSDRPEAYIPRDRRRSLAAGRAMPDRVRGAALFADISGFTPLTEALALELGPQRGAEELTANIGRVFHAVIAELDAYDGNVIYFSGDAITCWIDGDDGVLACAAALGMQEAIRRSGTITTPDGTVVVLQMKIAVAVGEARRFLVGDPDIQLIDVLAGRLIDDLAAAEHHAEKGQIVLDESAIRSLGDRVLLGETHHDEETDRETAVLRAVLVDTEESPAYEPPPLPEDLVRPWLLPAVYERMRTGRGEFLTELRPAIPVFVRFTGIDYDNDDDAIGKLDDFVRASQRVFTAYGGNLLQLTLGDKGAYLYGVFGSPVAHEDDAARAAGAALELRDLERSTAAREIQVGLAQGRLRSGTYGHAMRRTFVCLGDAVNLAARLMSAAPRERIYVAGPVRRAAGDAYIWERLPDLTVKGKTEPVEVWSLNGSLERASRRKTRFELRLVGRTAELARLEAGLADALGQHSRVIGIAAEAGMGKSRLIAEFVRNARRRGLFVAFGECQAFGSTTAYVPWREIWRRLLHLEDGDPEAAQVEHLERELAVVDPGLVARAPLLDGVVGLPIPDTALTSGFDAKLRKQSLEALLADVLRARARTEPLVIVIEDAHWIDELSRDLLQALVRASAGLRVLFVVAYRPATEPGGELGLGGSVDELVLDRLGEAEAEAVVRSKLEQVLGADAEAGADLVRLVVERADGNPLYVEELVSYIASSAVDLGDPAAVAAIQLPESLHSLVLSRIDTVAEDPRRTLKVASVVGRVFRAPVLAGAYEELGTVDAVLGNLETLRAKDLVAPERIDDASFLFKHVVTQEVAYASMPFALRTELHGRVGRYLEDDAPEVVEQRLDILAHHFWLGDDEGRKRDYLRRAGDAAQASYANGAAIDYYGRLVPLLEGAERVRVALDLAGVLQLVGDMPRAEQVAQDARGWAVAEGDDRARARCEYSLAETARRQARFDEALSLLASAGAAFRALDDRPGTADVLRVTGTVHAQRGELAEAAANYDECLRIRESLDDPGGVAAVSNNLAIVTVRRGDPDAARAWGERALELYEALGDRRYICSCHVNLAWLDSMAGAPAAALAHCEEAVRLAGEVGDRLNLALANNNMGDALRDLGRLEDAAAAYAAAVEGYRDLGDPGPLMALFEDVAVLTSLRGRNREAFLLLGASDAVRVTLGSPRPEDAESEIVARLLPGIGFDDAEAARAKGSALTIEAAVAAALDACGRPVLTG